MSARYGRFAAFGSGSTRGKTAAAVFASAVMLLTGCGGSGAADAGAPVIRGEVPGTDAPAAGAAQATLTVSGSTSTSTVGTAIVLAAKGGSGTGEDTFAVTGSGCSVSGSALTATISGSCTVVVTKAASTGYPAATSAPVTFTFTAGSASSTPNGSDTASASTTASPSTTATATATSSPSTTATVSASTNASAKAIWPSFAVRATPRDYFYAYVGGKIAVIAEGYPGEGPVVLTTTTPGCTISGSYVTRATVGECSVGATQGDYRTASDKVFPFVTVEHMNSIGRAASTVATGWMFEPYAPIPPGCANWWALLSIFGEEEDLERSYNIEPYSTISDVIGGQRTPVFCGDTWIPGGLVDTGWTIADKRRTVDFGGWNTKQDGTGVAYTPGVPAPIPAPIRGPGSTQDMKLYPQWRSCCTISFEANGGSGSTTALTGLSVGSTITLPPVAFTRPGYAASEWFETTASHNMMCVYVFLGNCAHADSVAEASWPTNGSFYVNRSMVLQPDWQPAWTVAFDGNGGSLGAAAKMPPQVFWDKAARRLSQNNFARAGYKFVGWNTAANGSGTAYAQQQTITPPADITLYAQWSCTTCYAVTFDPNGGSGTQLSPLASTGGSSVTVPASTPYTKAGNSFSGWNSAANGTGTAYAPGSTFTPTSTMTLYAQWQSSFTVTFDANGGTGAMASQTANAAKALTSNTFIRAGFAFDGWSTSSNGTRAYTNGASYPFTSNAALYARWICRPFTVTATAVRFGNTQARVAFRSIGSEVSMTSLTATATVGGSTASVTTSSNVGEIVVSGLDKTKKYKFKVTGTNAAGCSSTSGETSTSV